MKKVFALAGAISMSAMLSACHMMGDEPPPPRPDMGQHQNWDAQHADHMEKMRMMSEHLFNKMDANQDGEISYKEFMDFQRKMFREADTDHNGYLTLDEWNAEMAKKMKTWKHDGRMRDQGVTDDGMHSDMNYPESHMRDDTMSDMERNR